MYGCSKRQTPHPLLKIDGSVPPTLCPDRRARGGSNHAPKNYPHHFVNYVPARAAVNASQGSMVQASCLRGFTPAVGPGRTRGQRTRVIPPPTHDITTVIFFSSPEVSASPPNAGEALKYGCLSRVGSKAPHPPAETRIALSLLHCGQQTCSSRPGKKETHTKVVERMVERIDAARRGR
jgi:hypothetical protein